MIVKRCPIHGAVEVAEHLTTCPTCADDQHVFTQLQEDESDDHPDDARADRPYNWLGLLAALIG